MHFAFVYLKNSYAFFFLLAVLNNECPLKRKHAKSNLGMQARIFQWANHLQPTYLQNKAVLFSCFMSFFPSAFPNAFIIFFTSYTKVRLLKTAVYFFISKLLQNIQNAFVHTYIYSSYIRTYMPVIYTDGVTISLNCAHKRACFSSCRWYTSMVIHSATILTWENQRTRRKTCPSAILSFTNIIWTDKGANPGLHGERPATNRLGYGMAWVHACIQKTRLHIRTL
jgi:hypothetical protein